MKQGKGKLIIFSAPSGSGKSSIIHRLMSVYQLPAEFSISATSRPPRGEEKDGVDYYFLTPQEFEQKITNGEFLEYEEVYSGLYYGTLKKEINNALEKGRNIILDVDVKGALAVKRQYGESALAIFIEPPSVEVLKERLEKRGTDTPEKIQQRVEKATEELTYISYFDRVVSNEELSVACEEVYKIIFDFIK